MRPKCLFAASQAMGRALTAAESKDIEARVLGAMRQLARTDRAKWSAMSGVDRLMEAGQLAAKQILGEAKLRAEREALTIAAHGRIEARIADLTARGIDELDAIDRLVVFKSDGKSRALSIESVGEAIRYDSLSRIRETLDATAPKAFGLFADAKGEWELEQELHGEDSGNGESRSCGH